MSLSIVEKSQNFVAQSFFHDPKLKTRGNHLINTEKYLLILKPEAGDALRVAALLHDIDSAFIHRELTCGFRDAEYLYTHQLESARIAKDFVMREMGDEAFAQQVFDLINKHEVGGSTDQDILKDADSLSFFDRDLRKFIEKHSGNTLDQIKEKFDWMYDRITLSQAKEIAKPYYEIALKELDKK